MKFPLTNPFKRFFAGKSAGMTAGIAMHQKFVRVVLGKVVGANWEYVSHEELEIDSDEQWAETLEILIAKNVFNDARCSIILPPNRYQLLQIDKPAIPEEEISGSLTWNIKDLVNLPQEDVIADYFNVPAKIPMQSDKINVVVTSRKTIMPLIDVFLNHKIELDGIVPEEMVIRNVIGDHDVASLLLSQQKNEETALQIVKKDKIYFARKLRGFNRIHEYTAAELGDGLTDSLSLEIQRSMDYFESQLKQAPIKDIQLALPTEHQKAIAEQIAQHFPIEVKVMGISNGIVKLPLELPEQFYPALGGALEFFQGQVVHDAE